MDHSVECGNCGFIYGKHYFSSNSADLWCPNVDGSSAKGARGNFIAATGNEVFYNVWKTDEHRWVNADYENASYIPGHRFCLNDPKNPFRLHIDEAGAWRDKLTWNMGDIWEVRVIGPNATSLPLGSVPSKRKVTANSGKTVDDKTMELQFFRASLSSNTCDKCGAPCPCSYHD